MKSTPIALLIFNRPALTARVMERVREVRPGRLLVVADGPRSDRPGEVDLCERTRQTVLDAVDWQCEVSTSFAERNMGCRDRVSSGLDWVFSEVEEAIILEDDCLVDRSFFDFASALLERYRDDERVMMIGADNAGGFGNQTASYYFSRYGLIWGWASWRRAWQRYDVHMRDWPTWRDSRQLQRVLGDREQAAHWRRILDAVHAGPATTWDVQWLHAIWQHEGLSVLPTQNLVSNIGFGGESTHTGDGQSKDANRPTHAVAFPLVHPTEIEPDHVADRALFEHGFRLPRQPLLRRLEGGLRQTVKKVLPDGVRRSLRSLRLRGAVHHT